MSTAAEDEVLIEHRERVVLLTLNRPKALNAFTAEMVERVRLGVDQAAADPRSVAIVLGAGGRAFCAGADLKAARERAGGSAGERGDAQFLDSFRRMIVALREAPCPVIGAVQGMALAGGLELLLACDLIVAAQSATFGDAHANYGLLPGGGASVMLPRRIGVARAKYLAFTGEFLPAQTLCDWGLVNTVVPDEQLADATEALLNRLRGKSPLGLRRLKQLIDDGLEQPVEVGLRSELVMSEAHRHSHDRAEGLAAFAEKRPPNFNGS
jgi:enoyl-CoA hydratase/carnithine racemase